MYPTEELANRDRWETVEVSSEWHIHGDERAAWLLSLSEVARELEDDDIPEDVKAEFEEENGS